MWGITLDIQNSDIKDLFISLKIFQPTRSHGKYDSDGQVRICGKTELAKEVLNKSQHRAAWVGMEVESLPGPQESCI